MLPKRWHSSFYTRLYVTNLHDTNSFFFCRAKKNELRSIEMEEQNRRRKILEQRKNEREDLINRFLRGPVRASSPGRPASIAKKRISRSVPDLGESQFHRPSKHNR